MSLQCSLKDRLAARDPVLRQVFVSFHFGAKHASRRPVQPDTGASAPRLVGLWLYEKNFWSGTYSSTTASTLYFGVDGRFTAAKQYVGGTSGIGGDSLFPPPTVCFTGNGETLLVLLASVCYNH